MLLKGQNPQNESHFVLNKAFQWSKAPLFSWKTANKIKILQKLEENPQKLKENPQKLKENPQKLKEIFQKLEILTQKLPATEARCLAVPPICVEKKSLH